MTSVQPGTAGAPGAANGHIEARVFLQPIAAPSVLGYIALSAGLIIFGTWVAGAWGKATDFKGFMEFVMLFAGVAQLAAALWSYKARDAVGASIHGIWGAFWLGFGILWLTATTGALALPARGAFFGPAGQWFIYIAVITWTTALAALARSPLQCFTQAVLGSGAALLAFGFISGSGGWQATGGWLLVAAAFFSWYIAASFMINGTFGHVVLPQLSWQREGNIPGGRPLKPIEFAAGEPGVKAGQ
jgi:succinate-acetate transporter protein